MRRVKMVREVVRMAERKRGMERRRRGGRRIVERRRLDIVADGEGNGRKPCCGVHMDLISSCGGRALDEASVLTMGEACESGASMRWSCDLVSWDDSLDPAIK